MSNRDLKGILNHDLSLVDGLRSGTRHRSNSEKIMNLNSTSTGGICPPHPDVSSIQAEDLSGVDTLYRDTSDNGYMLETPIGKGSGTRSLRSSEDDYILPESIQSKHEELFLLVESYALDLIQKEGWRKLVDPEFSRIDDILKEFMRKAGLIGNRDYSQKAAKLRSQLANARTDWWKRITNEPSIPTHPRVNLSSRLSNSSPSLYSNENSSDSNAENTSTNPIIDNPNDSIGTVVDLRDNNPTPTTYEEGEVFTPMDEVEDDPKAKESTEEISFSNIIASLDWPELQKVITNQGNAQLLEQIDNKFCQISNKMKKIEQENKYARIVVNNQGTIDKLLSEFAQSLSAFKTTLETMTGQVCDIVSEYTSLKTVVDKLEAKVDNIEQSCAEISKISKQYDSLATVCENVHKIGNIETSVDQIRVVLDTVSETADVNKLMIESLGITIRDNKKKILKLQNSIQFIPNIENEPCKEKNQPMILIEGHGSGREPRNAPNPTPSSMPTVPTTVTLQQRRTTPSNTRVNESSMNQQEIPTIPISSINTRDVSSMESSDQLLSRNLMEHNINSLISQLDNKTKVVINNSSPELLIKDAKVHVAPTVEKLIVSCYSILQKYILFTHKEVALYNRATASIDNAQKWIEKVTDLYNEMETYSMDASKTNVVELTKFSPDGKQTIYEFLEDFEATHRGWGNQKQKADKLHRNFLSEGVQSLSDSMSGDYADLKKWLLKQYGDISTTTASIILTIERSPKPNNNDYKARSIYFMKFVSCLQKLQKLQERPEISEKDLENHIFSVFFMKRLTDLLPTEDEVEYSKSLDREGLDSFKISGKYSYKELINYCQRTGNAMERAASRTINSRFNDSKDKNKQKSVHGINNTGNEANSDSDNEFGSIHAVTQKSKPKQPNIWYDKNLKLPCALPEHNHELSGCIEFFTLTAKERKDKTTRKMCWTCFGPRDKCLKVDRTGSQIGACSNIAKVKTMICKGCQEFVSKEKKPYSAFNILLCSNDKHPRPTIQEIETSLQTWIPGFNTSVMSPILVVSANMTYGIHNIDRCYCREGEVCKCIFESRTRPSDPEAEKVIINTNTGQRVNPKSVTVVEEKSEDSYYIMQWLKMGSSDCLVFFDMGANIHLIDGPMAEALKLPIVTPKPTKLTVVGGAQLIPDYGVYKVNLGPNLEGEYFEVNCQGMNS